MDNNQKNYEAFFNSVDEFLFVLDEQGNIIHVNNTVLDRLLYKEKELVGKSVLMVHPEERREEAGRIVGEMLSGKAKFCPVPIISKYGVQIPVETRITHGFWDDKPALFGVAKDISQVRLSEEKFSKVFSINPSACGISDLDNHKFIEVNEAFYSLLGFSKDEVIGKTSYELGIVTPEMTKEASVKADSNGKITNFETDLKSKNGDIKHVLLSAESIYVQDKKYRFTVVEDITERKKDEDELKHREALLLGLSKATGFILSNSTINNKNITDTLKSVGEATLVDRVYIFEHIPGTDGSRGFMSQRYEWSLSNIKPQIDNPELQHISWDDSAPRWYDAFINGDYISGNVADFPTNERVGLEPQNIVSLLAIPIKVNDKFWGFIGFDVCDKPRAWNSSEVGLLKSMANSFAIVIERMKAEAEIKEKIEQIEKMNKFMTGRELKMVELKEEIIKLKGGK
jgi:PAS domain S-box-containing protein